MKQYLFLILLMATSSLALANTSDSDLDQAAPMHASAEPVIMVRQHDRAPAIKRKATSNSVKTQPMVIKFKPHKYATIHKNKKKPTMAMRPIHPPRRAVTNAPTASSPHKHKVALNSGKHTDKKRTPSGKASQQGLRMKSNPNKSGKTKIASADS